MPSVHRPLAGGAVRIYGERLLGTTAVTIGGRAAPDFRVVDGDLIIAMVPLANVPLVQNDGFAHIAVSDDEGNATTDLDRDGVVDLSDCTSGCVDFGPEEGAIFYTDATLTLSPSTGLDGGETTTATLTGHRPNQGGWPIVHFNPLANFLEDGPVDPDNDPPGPPYGAVLAFPPTNANGNSAPTVVPVAASPTFNAKDQDYDPDADCPVAQVTADYGLDRCLIGYSEFGMASMETAFAYSPDLPNLDPVPAAPTLTLTPSSGPSGTSVTVSGLNWNAAPHFGSDTTIDDPGESELLIDVCNVALTSCAAAGGADAAVGVTRYFDGGTDPDTPPITPVYTGATLSGSFTANTAGCTPDCVVRVRQQRHNIEINARVGNAFITATAPFSAPPPDSKPPETTIAPSGGGTTPAVMAAPPGGMTTTPTATTPCSGLTGAALPACQRREQVKRELAACQKKSGQARKDCIRQVGDRAACDSQTGQRKKDCATYAKQRAACDRLKGTKRRDCIRRAAALKRCYRLTGKKRSSCIRTANKIGRAKG